MATDKTNPTIEETTGIKSCRNSRVNGRAANAGLRLASLCPTDAARANAEARFWGNTNRWTATEHECWIWFNCAWWTGYGRYSVNGEEVAAHRFAYLVGVDGFIPDGSHVRHLCGRRGCVNPKHLRLGTNAENQADSVFAGGHRNAKALTPEQERQVREELAGKSWPRTVQGIAERYGVEVSTVARIAIKRRANASGGEAA